VGGGGPPTIRTVHLMPTTLKLMCCMLAVMGGCRRCSSQVSMRRWDRVSGRGNSKARSKSSRARARIRTRAKSKSRGRSNRHCHPNIIANTSKNNVKLVQAVAVESGATSNNGRGGNLVVKDHPTNPISLHAAPRERSGLKKTLATSKHPVFTGKPGM
jgi:hypothetical protein